MQIKASGKQTLGVLLIALVLIILCIGGLWAYVKSADAETGVTETTLAQIPGEDEIIITKEKYDSFPPHQETKDTIIWAQGFGLMKSEKERLATLQEAYAGGKRPSTPAATQPLKNGMAILPLDPNSFDGITEYYFLPKQALTDDQILQLIAYSEENGTPFTAETLTVRNSMRGSDSQTNRKLSAGELGRWTNLMQRVLQEGLASPDCGTVDSTKPLSGIAYIPLNPYAYGLDMFALYPLRELTDEELLLDVYTLRLDKGYTILNSVMEADLNPAADAKRVRTLLNDVMSMPASAKMTLYNYRRKDSTGDIHFYVSFETARINGKQTSYTATFDLATGKLLYLDQYVDDLAFPVASNGINSLRPKDDMYDPRWADIAIKAVNKCANDAIDHTEAEGFTFLGDEGQSGVQVNVAMTNGDAYDVVVRFSDGMVFSVQYVPKGQDSKINIW